MTRQRLSRLTMEICDRRSGVGADGVLFLSQSKSADRKFEICNADGGWAEKSGNGLRIAGLHLHLADNRKRRMNFETAVSNEEVAIVKRAGKGYLVRTSLGKPQFESKLVPVKSKQNFMINAPLDVNGTVFPVTCLSVGNPHTVLFVADFDFDWETLGADIEFHKAFPNRTNVEFVKQVTRRKVKLADWERGAGATGSSGTGAAAAVCAGVMLGMLERECEVLFESGSLLIEWVEETGIVELTGPAEFITKGTYAFA